MAANKAHVFRARLRGHGEALYHKANILVNGVTLRLFAAIVEAPEHLVDTGRARGGWMIAVEVPGDDVPPEITRAGASKSPLPIPSSDPFLSVLSAATLEQKRVVYNNVEYIVWIELGTDTREGMHVVRAAIARLLGESAEAA